MFNQVWIQLLYLLQFIIKTTIESGSYQATDRGGEGHPWAQVWTKDHAAAHANGMHIVFGHDAARGLQLHETVTGLDSGCCYGKVVYHSGPLFLIIKDYIGRKLSALRLPQRELVQVDALRVYEEVKVRTPPVH